MSRRIFVRNPLGELVEMNNPKILVSRDDFKGRGYTTYYVYKQYQIGDKFP